MSYSFTVQATSVDAAKEAVREKLGKIMEDQTPHKADVPEAIKASDAFLDLVNLADGCALSVTISGSVYVPEAGLNTVGFSIGVSQFANEAPAE